VVSDPAAPLVLLHGLLGDADDWRPVIQALPGVRAMPWICRATAATGHCG
jgi:pimeloyl-ACP methyl ester carboxylesterase